MAFEWNQYTEMSLGLKRILLKEDRIKRFVAAEDLRAALLRAIDDKVAEVTSFRLTPVEIIEIMPR